MSTRDSSHAPVLDAPAAHPRLRDAAAQSALGSLWQQRSARIHDVLEPGLAAELAPLLGRLPLAAQLDAAERELCWRCSVAMPAALDPQYPACMFRLARFLDRDLPALAQAVTGRAFTRERALWLDVQVYRKGSYLDAGLDTEPASPGADLAGERLHFVLGLTGATWPAAWGGHLELLDDHGQVAEQRAPGWDTLDLIAQSFRVPVVTHHVEALWVRGTLIATPEETAHAAPAPDR